MDTRSLPSFRIPFHSHIPFYPTPRSLSTFPVCIYPRPPHVTASPLNSTSFFFTYTRRQSREFNRPTSFDTTILFPVSIPVYTNAGHFEIREVYTSNGTLSFNFWFLILAIVLLQIGLYHFKSVNSNVSVKDLKNIY